MEQIRHWLFSMLYTGCFCSLIAMINPEEKTKKILEILCAAIMGLTFISPILEFSTEDLTAFLNNSVELKPSAIIEYSVEQAYMEGKYSAYICNEAKGRQPAKNRPSQSSRLSVSARPNIEINDRMYRLIVITNTIKAKTNNY